MKVLLDKCCNLKPLNVTGLGMSGSSATIQFPKLKIFRPGLYFLDIRPIATLGPFEEGLKLGAAQFSPLRWIRFLYFQKGALANGKIKFNICGRNSKNLDSPKTFSNAIKENLSL